MEKENKTKILVIKQRRNLHFCSKWSTKLLQRQVRRSGFWPSKYLPILTGTDNDGSSAVRSDEHSQLGITGHFVSTQGGLPGTVIQRYLTKTTEKKSSPGPSWPFLFQQKGSSERSLVGFRPCQASSLFKSSCFAGSYLGRAPSDLLSGWDVGAEIVSRGAATSS